MTKARGKFIVLEGLDGAGTTTQAARLHETLSSRGMIGHLTREPTDGPVGRLIRAALSGELAPDDSGEGTLLPENVLCLLFAADRIHHSGEIERYLSAGTHVISDRYVHSSIAYQALDPAISAERVIAVNQGIAIPDVTFFLRVPVDECLRRLESRGGTQTVYEKRDLLVAVEKNYDESLEAYERHFGPVVEIDGTRDIDNVHSAILGNVGKQLFF
jgi:dTMP kinase